MLVSDNESWVYATGRSRTVVRCDRRDDRVAEVRQEPAADSASAAPKLVCIDIQPYGSTQAPERDDILNIGGFSDAVFNVVASYLSDDAARFVAEVESIEL